MNDHTKLWRYRDALTKIDSALSALATGEGDIKSRLRAAYNFHLIKLSVDDFPDELGIKENFKWVISQLTSAEIPQYRRNNPLFGDRVFVSLYRRKRKSCRKIAEGIVTIRSKLETLLKTYSEYNPDK